MIDICTCIKCIYGVRYTVLDLSLTERRHQHQFSYYQPKIISAKTSISKQTKFIEHCLVLAIEAPVDYPTLFYRLISSNNGR